jgi:NADH dehydrogenase
VSDTAAVPNTGTTAAAAVTPSHIVILGAGFAGLEAAKALRRAPVRVTVVDQCNHFVFQPLLYQVATAALNPSDIAAPVRRVLRSQRNAEVLLAEAVSIDRATRTVILRDGSLPYDHLIVATGATHSYFGHDDWAAHAPGLKSIHDALTIRARFLLAFEKAEREPDPEARRSWMTFVVVGAGPTGVELAGTLAEVSRKTLARDFRRIDPTQARVVLVEAGPHVLSTFVPLLSASARRQLEQLGVEVRTDEKVTGIDASGVELGPNRIEARTVLWAAGVAASPLARSLGAPLDRAGRVLVEPDLTLPGDERVSVVGDLMHVDHDGRPVPGVAPAAIQAGRLAADNIVRRLRGQPARSFQYRDKGSLATIGRAKGVAQIGRWQFSGYFAWVTWLFVHILFLIGFRNRILVLIQWAWLYVTYDRGARLIVGTLEDPPAGETPGHHVP